MACSSRGRDKTTDLYRLVVF